MITKAFSISSNFSLIGDSVFESPIFLPYPFAAAPPKAFLTPFLTIDRLGSDGNNGVKSGTKRLKRSKNHYILCFQR